MTASIARTIADPSLDVSLKYVRATLSHWNAASDSSLGSSASSAADQACAEEREREREGEDGTRER